MTGAPHLPFDPIDRASELWVRHFGDPASMRVATSIIRVHQILLNTLDTTLRPYGITFARYEVLALISFSREGRLTLSKIGERLMVHPTSVTNAIDRLVAQGLVLRRVDEGDRRRVLASLTEDGHRVLRDATAALHQVDFGLPGLPDEDLDALYGTLKRIRAAAGDFPG
jgi:DNA-binding MarR family transcriptional regulator